SPPARLAAGVARTTTSTRTCPPTPGPATTHTGPDLARWKTPLVPPARRPGHATAAGRSGGPAPNMPSAPLVRYAHEWALSVAHPFRAAPGRAHCLGAAQSPLADRSVLAVALRLRTLCTR